MNKSSFNYSFWNFLLITTLVFPKCQIHSFIFILLLDLF